MADYFIGDTHFGCERILSVRPGYNSTLEMDESILRNWEEKVSRKDHVYILGDLFDPSFPHPESYLDKMVGQKHLILGNHDPDWMKTVDPLLLRTTFVEIAYYVFIEKPEYCLTLCHYPALEWYNSNHDETSYLIHGHMHTRRNGRSFDYIQRYLPRALNCCPEINYYIPSTLEELIENNKRWYSVES